MKIKKTIALSLFRSMLRIRIAEEEIADIYPDGEMRTPTHFSIGQEAVSARNPNHAGTQTPTYC